MGKMTSNPIESWGLTLNQGMLMKSLHRYYFPGPSDFPLSVSDGPRSTGAIMMGVTG